MSNSPHNGLRSIRESDKAAGQRDAAERAYDRVEQAWIGDTWRLVREPEAGIKISEGNFLMKFPSFLRLGIGLPSIAILYTFDDSYVDVLSIKFSDED